jgi:hypothetical protein
MWSMPGVLRLLGGTTCQHVNGISAACQFTPRIPSIRIALVQLSLRFVLLAQPKRDHLHPGMPDGLVALIGPAPRS